MPLYEYRCTACGHTFEKIQSFSAPDEKECPKCGALVERLISAPAIQFKGSGFYLTDYGKTGGKSGSDKSEGGKSEGGKSESAKSDAKSDGKSSASSGGAESGSSASSTPSSNSSNSGSTSSNS